MSHIEDLQMETLTGFLISSQSKSQPAMESREGFAQTTGFVRLTEHRHAQLAQDPRPFGIYQAIQRLVLLWPHVPVYSAYRLCRPDDLGIDSLLVMEVTNEIKTAFGVDTGMNTFLFFPNLQVAYSYVYGRLLLHIIR